MIHLHFPFPPLYTFFIMFWSSFNVYPAVRMVYYVNMSSNHNFLCALVGDLFDNIRRNSKKNIHVDYNWYYWVCVNVTPLSDTSRCFFFRSSWPSIAHTVSVVEFTVISASTSCDMGFIPLFNIQQYSEGASVCPLQLSSFSYCIMAASSHLFPPTSMCILTYWSELGVNFSLFDYFYRALFIAK